MCYSVKATEDSTDQTPGGVFSSSIQAYTRSPLFDDCVNDSSGATAFPGTPVESNCLFNAKKLAELCNPMDVSAVTPPRITSAPTVAGTSHTTQSLLCYKPSLSGSFNNATSASLGGGTVGADITPRQSKAVKHSTKAGDPVNLNLSDQFNEPQVLDTGKPDRLCIPATVISSTPAP